MNTNQTPFSAFWRFSHSVRRFCVLGLLGLLGAGVQTQAVTLFRATITGSQENPPVTTDAFGFATFELNDAQDALTFTATIFGIDVNGDQTPGDLTDNLRAAHIHAPALPGSNAGVVWGFFGSPFNDTPVTDTVLTPFATGVGGVFTSKWDLQEGNGGTTLAAQLPNILGGLSYINFHTEGHPSGEIRGQILQVPETGNTLAMLCLGVAGLGMIRLGRLGRERLQ